MTQETKQRIEQIKRGEVPQGYKRTKVGIVPSEWEVRSVESYLNRVSRPITKPTEKYWRLGLRSHAKGTFHELVEDPSKINMDELYVVNAGDFILNITFAWEHAIAVAIMEDQGMLVSHRFPTYEKTKMCNMEYWKYYTLRSYFKLQLDLISPGGAGRNRVMKQADFLTLPVCIPPLTQQQKIAEILTTQDKAIDLKEKLLAEKQKQKKWLMQNLLTGKKRLSGFSGEWKKAELGDLGETFGGLTGKSKEDFGKGKPYVTYMNIFKNSIIDNKSFAYVQVGDEEKQNKLMYGDIFFTTSSETPEEVGMSSVLLSEVDELYLNSFCFGLRLYNFNILSPVFAVHYFRGGYFRNILNVLAQGATRFNLSKNNLMKCKLSLPPLPEQTAIAEILSTADREIDLMEKDIAAEKQKKKALMQLLLTGIVRVNV